MIEEGVYLIEATVYDPAIAGTRVLRYSTGVGYVHEGHYYEPRIKHPGRLKRALFSEGRTGGPSQTGYGEVVLVNTDGGLDALITYGFSGRPLMIKRALAIGAALTAVTTLAACSMEQPTCTWDEVGIRIRDRQQEFNVPLQPNKYGGTNNLPNGLDGTADIQGQPKPLLFGRAKNVSPVCVNTARLIYQVHDGALQAVEGCYDRGVPLANGAPYASQAEMEATAPQPGQYRAWLAGGFVRLGAAPAGLVTVDAVEGAGAADRSAARLFERMAVRASTVAAPDLSAADIAALHAVNSAEVGYYAAAETTLGAAIDQVLGSVGGWYGFDASGLLRCGRLVAPAGEPAVALSEGEILSLGRVPTGDEGRGVPVWLVNLGYDRNWSAAIGGWAPKDSLAQWLLSSLPASLTWKAVAYGAEKFVAVASGPTAVYATSFDGRIWEQRAMPEALNWTAITYAHGQFVALASSVSRCYTSPDGIVWTQRTLPASTSWRFVVNAGGTWLAVSGSNIGATSPDGVTWTLRALPSNNWTDAAAGGGLFALIKGGSDFATSPDGITWTWRNLPSVTYPVWSAIRWEGGLWIALSNWGVVAASRDAIQWEVSGTIPRSGQSRITSFGGEFIVAGGGSIYRSNDGGLWVRVPVAQDLGSAAALAVSSAGAVAFQTVAASSQLVSLSLISGVERESWLTSPVRVINASDPSIKTAHLLAREITVDALLITQSAAQAEAARLLALHSVARDRLRVSVPRHLVPADILGQVVRLSIPRYGYGGGKLFVVIGVEDDFGGSHIVLDLWG